VRRSDAAELHRRIAEKAGTADGYDRPARNRAADGKDARYRRRRIGHGVHFHRSEHVAVSGAAVGDVTDEGEGTRRRGRELEIHRLSTPAVQTVFDVRLHQDAVTDRRCIVRWDGQREVDEVSLIDGEWRKIGR